MSQIWAHYMEILSDLYHEDESEISAESFGLKYDLDQ